MVTVIVPVYNCEKYLAECLDSIIRQTYRDLCIIVVDDASIDSSGEICDRYARLDNRITVIHFAENRGISVARNTAIDLALKNGSEYIAFLDSDDWIEPNMYEIMIDSAEKTGADVIVCGGYKEYPQKQVEFSVGCRTLFGDECLSSLIKGDFTNMVWNKLWRNKCFSDVRFPVGKNYEDIQFVSEVFFKVLKTNCLCYSFYHYRQNKGSIVQSPSLDNYFNLWSSYLFRYNLLIETSLGQKLKPELLKQCTYSASLIWKNFLASSKNERLKYKIETKSIASFLRNAIPLGGFKGWPFKIKVLNILTRRDSFFCFILLGCTNYFIRRIKVKTLFE